MDSSRKSPRISPMRSASPIAKTSLSNGKMKLDIKRQSVSPITRYANPVESIINCPVNSICQVVKNINVNSIPDKRNSKLIDKIIKLVNYFTDTSAINAENNLLKEKLTSLSDIIKDFKNMGKDMEKLSEENKKLKFQLISLTEDNQLN